VLSMGGVDKTSISELSLLKTAPGPELVFAWARAKNPTGADSQFAAGYMPWGYWGYSAIAKGPRAADLMTQLFKRMSLGPGAQQKLVEATLRVPLPSDLKLAGGGIPLLPVLGALALLIILVVFFHGKRRA